jgi:hypothetical protein
MPAIGENANEQYLFTSMCGTLRYSEYWVVPHSLALAQGLWFASHRLDVTHITRSIFRTKVAPEVGLGHPYNESCDTFSFALVLWQMMVLERPYGTISPDDLMREVWLDQKRPSNMDSTRSRWGFYPWRRYQTARRRRLATLPAPLQTLVQQGWSANPKDRPRMEHVAAVLQSQIIALRNGDDTILRDRQRRRSTNVFRRTKSQREAIAHVVTEQLQGQ